MKINAGQASSTLIPEYIGSAFDKIVTVADNIKHIKDIAASIEGFCLWNQPNCYQFNYKLLLCGLLSTHCPESASSYQT